MRRITIIVMDDNSGFDVEEDGKICDGLCWDEMLGQVALLTVPPSRVRNGYAMKTPEEWAAERGARTQPKPEQDPPMPTEGL